LAKTIKISFIFIYKYIYKYKVSAWVLEYPEPNCNNCNNCNIFRLDNRKSDRIGTESDRTKFFSKNFLPVNRGFALCFGVRLKNRKGRDLPIRESDSCFAASCEDIPPGQPLTLSIIMSVYVIYYQNRAKMMRPVTSREQYKMMHLQPNYLHFSGVWRSESCILAEFGEC